MYFAADKQLARRAAQLAVERASMLAQTVPPFSWSARENTIELRVLPLM
jgi:hypothetical protein